MGSRLTVIQILPALDAGGVEKGTLEIARALVSAGHRSIVISAGGRMVERLVREGSEHLAWDVGAKRLSTLRWIPRLHRLFAHERPDIVHARSRLPAWVAWWALKGFAPEFRPHFLTTVHGPYTPGRYSRVMTYGERVIAISAMMREYVVQHYPRVPVENIRVIPRGVDASEYPHGYVPDAAWLQDFRHLYPSLAGSYVITLPARLTRWKGQDHFLDIIAGLKSRGIPVHGLIVGEAHPKKRAYEAHLRARARRLGLNGSVSFTGHRTDVREIMAISDVVVSPSLEPEAFGRVTLEALSLGRPVAAYAHGGVAEQLDAIFPAGKVAVGDKDAMEELLALWYQQRPVVPAENPFTLARMQEETLGVYHELAGR
jgi:glycosyltransferase involved in cell wall biosynthesis